MKTMCLEDFLRNIKPFLSGDNLRQFMRELRKVPNYEKVFLTLLEKDPTWLEKVKARNGAYFFLEEVSISKDANLRPNELGLRHFSEGQYPTIKVTKYKPVLVKR